MLAMQPMLFGQVTHGVNKQELSSIVHLLEVSRTIAKRGAQNLDVGHHPLDGVQERGRLSIGEGLEPVGE